MPPREPSRPRRRIKAETFAAVIRAYQASEKFARLAPNTQASYKRILDRAELPEILGAYSVEVIRPSLVQAFLDGIPSASTQAVAKCVLQAVEKWALVRDLIPRTITTGTEALPTDGAHEPWSDAEVALAEAHARPALARVVTLAANTGQRRSDLVKMRFTDLEEIDGRLGINVTQKKTGLQIWVPFPAEFLAVFATWERRPGSICLNEWGRPWKPASLTVQWERERENVPELAPLGEKQRVLHGLRATACVRLNRAGATARQIADWAGMSVQTVERYLRKSVQRQNALAAVLHLDAARNARRTAAKVKSRK